MSNQAAAFIHPHALVETDHVGPGTRVWAFAHVMRAAKIGAGCNICDHAFVESNVTLGNNVTVKNGVAIWDGVTVEDDVFLGPNAVFTNDPNPRAEVKKPRDQWLPTLIRKGATVGANATILCGLTVGRYSFVGAGCVVVESVPDHALVLGVPGKVAGWMCRCATRLRIGRGAAQCPRCGLKYRRAKEGLRETS